MSKASRTARRAMAMTPPIAAASPQTGTWLRSQVVDWVGAGTAGAAGLFWLLGHVPGTMASIAIPEWVLFGLAAGALRPWLGVALTVAVVPFLGGAVEQPIGEALRVVPIYGAAARVLIDRATGETRPAALPRWVVLAAVVAGALYLGTFVTFLATIGGEPADLPHLGWLVGGPTAGLAAWIAASHLAPPRRRQLADVVLMTTLVAVPVALAAWLGIGAVQWFVFPALVYDRLAAFGYPTPTGMGLALALPFAFAAAQRRNGILAAAVAVGVLLAIVLTESRGPLLAIAAGALVAVAVNRRADPRLVLAVLAAGFLVAVGFIVIGFGTNPSAILAGLDQKANGDAARVASWGAGVRVVVASPLLGGGWHALARYGDATTLATGVIQSHNLFLHAFSEGGLPLGFAFGAVVVYSAVHAWRRRRTTEAWVLAAVVIYLVCGIWDFPQVRSYASVMGGLALGVAASGLPAGSRLRALEQAADRDPGPKRATPPRRTRGDPLIPSIPPG